MSLISDIDSEVVIKELINSRFHIELLKKRESWNLNMITSTVRILGNITFYDVDILVKLFINLRKFLILVF